MSTASRTALIVGLSLIAAVAALGVILVSPLAVTTENDVTTITGDCPSQWFGYCSLELTVTLPAPRFR
ncbi:MAG: hypothetical protein H7311_05250 [Ramlibacter sp.]|nr:hypothetical protein [Cryobacterium sp.]